MRVRARRPGWIRDRAEEVQLTRRLQHERNCVGSVEEQEMRRLLRGVRRFGGGGEGGDRVAEHALQEGGRLFDVLEVPPAKQHTSHPQEHRTERLVVRRRLRNRLVNRGNRVG